MIDRIIFAAFVAILASACGLAVAIVYLFVGASEEARIITATGAFAGAALGIYCGMFKRT